MKTSTKLILTAAAIGTLGLGGLAKLVNAAQTQSLVAVMPAAQVTEKSDGDGEANPATEAPENDPKSQLQANNQKGEANDGETNDDAKEQQESQKLQSLAKITPQQAQQAAEASAKGTASSVKLENENGNLVYAVAIGQNEVIVDAGNSKILGTNTPNSENNEKTQPRSSIQVSQSGSDGDGETNDDG
jgi:Peptidase propeptide and YPEB domain